MTDFGKAFQEAITREIKQSGLVGTIQQVIAAGKMLELRQSVERLRVLSVGDNEEFCEQFTCPHLAVNHLIEIQQLERESRGLKRVKIFTVEEAWTKLRRFKPVPTEITE